MKGEAPWNYLEGVFFWGYVHRRLMVRVLFPEVKKIVVCHYYKDDID